MESVASTSLFSTIDSVGDSPSMRLLRFSDENLQLIEVVVCWSYSATGTERAHAPIHGSLEIDGRMERVAN